MAKKENPENINLSGGSESLNSNKIDAVRDLIFGQQIQDYDSQFQELTELIIQQRSEVDEKMMSLHNKLLDTLNALNENLSKVISENKAHTDKEISRIDFEKTNRATLGKMLLDVGEKLLKD